MSAFVIFFACCNLVCLFSLVNGRIATPVDKYNYDRKAKQKAERQALKERITKRKLANLDGKGVDGQEIAMVGLDEPPKNHLGEVGPLFFSHFQVDTRNPHPSLYVHIDPIDSFNSI